MVTVKRIIDWPMTLDSARTTVGKDGLNKEPSESFKKDSLISEHSHIRNLTYEMIWDDIPYWTAMHFRTHHQGFKSGEDDLYFVQTQRTDRTQTDRDKLPQDAPVRLRVVMNAQSIINVSRVRLCHLTALETRGAWSGMLYELSNIEPHLTALCVPNCHYRNRCPEGSKCCGYNRTDKSKKELEWYKTFCGNESL